MDSIPTALIRLSSPIGRLELTGDDVGVLTLSIEREGHLPLETQPETPSPVLEEAARQLTEYFAGMPILIGCHRVLAGNGRITGYSGGSGIPTKEWLLAHEGIEYRS
jgi:hypothetical protein